LASGPSRTLERFSFVRSTAAVVPLSREVPWPPIRWTCASGSRARGCGDGCRGRRGEVRRQPRLGASADPTATRNGFSPFAEATEVSTSRPQQSRRRTVSEPDHGPPGCDSDGAACRVADNRGPQHAVAHDRPLGIYAQKKRYTPTNSDDLMSRPRGGSGGPGSHCGTCASTSSWMNVG